MSASCSFEHYGYMKDSCMSTHRKRLEKALGLTLIGAGLSASAWLLGHWHEREQRWRWAREISRGLALNALSLPSEEPETTISTDPNDAESWSTT
jgi:hypothetical protein